MQASSFSGIAIPLLGIRLWIVEFEVVEYFGSGKR
jgi:hypothetical protein